MENRLEPLIVERAPWLASGRFKPLRRAADRLLRFGESVALAEILADMPPERIMSVTGAMIACNLTKTGLENIPRHGPALIVSNHPTGIADGIVLNHVLAGLRPDLFFYANRDILRVFPQLADRIAPVEWRAEKRTRAATRATLDYTRSAMAQGRIGVIFPSGRLAKRRGLSLHERPWMPSAALIAKRHAVPVIPLNIRARNSVLFYLLDLMHPTLRDISLFHEVLNKDRQPFALTFGRPIHPADLPAAPEDAIAMLRNATLSLGHAQRPTVSLLHASRTPSWLEPLSPLP